MENDIRRSHEFQRCANFLEITMHPSAMRRRRVLSTKTELQLVSLMPMQLWAQSRTGCTRTPGAGAEIDDWFTVRLTALEASWESDKAFGQVLRSSAKGRRQNRDLHRRRPKKKMTARMCTPFFGIQPCQRPSVFQGGVLVTWFFSSSSVWNSVQEQVPRRRYNEKLFLTL